MQDGRHGHRSLLRGAVRTFLEGQCRQAPQTPSSTMQMKLQECFDLHVSTSQINRVRAALGVSNHPKSPEPGEKKTGEGSAFPHLEWQEGAGSLLLLAAAEPTELLPQLESALSPNLLTTDSSLRLAHSQPETLHKQLVTLLFLEAVGLRRTWDLRGYSDQALALLTSARSPMAIATLSVFWQS